MSRTVKPAPAPASFDSKLVRPAAPQALSDYQLHRLIPALPAMGYGGSSTYYDDVQDGLAPPPVKVGARASFLPEYEIAALTRARIAGATPDQLRALVRDLLAQRVALMPTLAGGRSAVAA